MGVLTSIPAIEKDLAKVANFLCVIEDGFEYVTGDTTMAEKPTLNASNRKSYGSVKSMKSLNMFKQSIRKPYFSLVILRTDVIHKCLC